MTELDFGRTEESNVEDYDSEHEDKLTAQNNFKESNKAFKVERTGLNQDGEQNGCVEEKIPGNTSCSCEDETVTPAQESINTHLTTISCNNHENVDFNVSNSREISDAMIVNSSERRESLIEDLNEDNSNSIAQHYHDDDYESIPTCRICHCDGEVERLISPCLCTGTVKHVHQSCFTDWLKRCVKTKCELCLHPIAVNKKTKPLKQVCHIVEAGLRYPE